MVLVICSKSKLIISATNLNCRPKSMQQEQVATYSLFGSSPDSQLRSARGAGFEPLRAIVLALPLLQELHLGSGGDQNRALVTRVVRTKGTQVEVKR